MVSDLSVPRKRAADFSLGFSVILLFLLPSLLFVAGNFSSLAFGVLLASLLVLVINLKIVLNFRFYPIYLAVYALFFFLILHACVAFLVSGEEKPLFSSVIFVVFISAMCLGQKVEQLSYQTLENTLYLTIFILFALGWLKLFWTPGLLGYGQLEKPVFPFSEESHFALAVGLLSCGVVYTISLKKAFFIVSNIIFLAISYPNMTLLVFGLLCLFLTLTRFQPLAFWAFAALALLTCLGGAVIFIDELEYFTSRLDFVDTKNLTTLVYLQGWGLAFLNFLDTDGLGIGFQLLGESGTTYPSFTDKIVMLTGRNFNTEDGGFLAAKLIAEFGVVALIGLVAYFCFIISFLLKANIKRFRVAKEGVTQSGYEKKRLMLLAFIFGFMVEVFLRGYGYFSPGVFWIIAITVALHCMHMRSKHAEPA